MADTLDRGSYVFGGYVVTRPVAAPTYVSGALLPPRLLTVSSCFASFVPDVWALRWSSTSAEEREAEARGLGIEGDVLESVMDHVTAGFDRGDHGWPNIVMSRDALVRLFSLLPSDRAWHALALALHRDHVDRFVEAHAPRPGEGATGIIDLLSRGAPLGNEGEVLGFEPLGFELGGEPHSWLCHDLPSTCERALGVRPASSGLLSTEEDAARVLDWIRADENRAEPVPWFPWLLLDGTPRSP